MNKERSTHRCPGCFEKEAPLDGEPCPVCGWSGGEGRPPLALPVQTELKGRYQAGRVLGEPGGFGVTYLGYDRLEGQKVAIKEYFPREVAGRDTDGRSVVAHSGEGSEEFRYGKEQFLGEAQTLARFDHANIVSVRDFFEENGTAYLVMEYYEGKTLESYLGERPDGRMEPEAATEVMLRVLDGLKAVHEEGYLHRDVKPENVYLTKEGRPILIDFGAARQAVGERSQSLSVVMTPGYAPYEQYSRKGNQGPHTDVYGAGATLYRMVTGEKPPAATDRVIEDTLQEPGEVNPEVAEGLSRAIMGALQMGDEERTPNAGVFQEQLQAGIEGGKTITSKEERNSSVESVDSFSQRDAPQVPREPSETNRNVRGQSVEEELSHPTAKNEEDSRSWSKVTIGILLTATLALVGVVTYIYYSGFFEENVFTGNVKQASAPEQERESRVEAETKRLLKEARAQLEAGRIVTPESKNALASVRKVLDVDPGNERAESLRRRIVSSLVQKGDSLRSIGKPVAAAGVYEQSLAIKAQREVEEKLEAVRSREMTMTTVTWPSAMAITHVQARILESRYDVEVGVREVARSEEAFSSVAENESDFFNMAWLPRNHESPWIENKKDLRKLGYTYAGTSEGIAVPSYVDVDTFPDLKNYQEELDGTLRGIVSGSAINSRMRGTLKLYGMEDEFSVQPVSGPANWQFLEHRIENRRPVVVAGWRPHWKWTAFDLKYIDGAKTGQNEEIWGQPGNIFTVVDNRFPDEFPREAVCFLKEFRVDDNQFGSLTLAFKGRGDKSEKKTAAQWIRENQDDLDQWTEKAEKCAASKYSVEPLPDEE